MPSLLSSYMKKLGIIFSVIIVSLMPWAVPTATAGNNNALGNMGDITITLEAGQYEINEVGKYSVIEMEGFGSILNPGEPKLPSKTFLVGLPPGGEAVSVDMVTSDYAEIPGEYHIMPAPPIISLQEDEEVKWEENEEIYSSEGPYPPSPYEYLGMGQMRKYNFARVRFCPIAYYSVSNKLGLYQSITLKIKYEITEVVSSELLSDTVLDDVASQIIFNYAPIKSEYQAAIAPSAVSYNYVIITTDSLQSAVQPLVTWKTAIGYSVNVVTTSWISSNYPGIDLPEQIRNFLIDKYAEWGIKYVLIVGSHSTIPMRYCYPDPSDHNPDNYSMFPTDYYYADLTGNWDSDGDGYFGEEGEDNVDFYPEVYVGRIPVDNASVLGSICQKSVGFEQDSGAWKKKALLLGGIGNYQNQDGHGVPKKDAAALMEACWNNILKPNGYSSERMYEKAGLAPSTYACDHPLSDSNVLDPSYGWPSGYGTVNWGAHAGQTAAYRKVWAWDDSDGVPESAEMTWPAFIRSSDTSSLDDSKPAIVFSCSCLTAYPENADNLGNSLLRQGAVAFVGATRIAAGVLQWENEGDGGCQSIDYYFFYYLINRNQNCGDALYMSKVYCYDYLTGNPCYHNMFAFCLYGDPSLGTATIAIPPDITVHPDGFDVTLLPNTIDSNTMEIGNEGGTTLIYNISEAIPHELIYDDGERNGCSWMGDVDEGHDVRKAVRFTPSSYPVRLDTARVCLRPNMPDSDHEGFAVEVYDDDGIDGAPGSLLGTAYTIATNWDWWDVDISGLDITITSGDFYIAYRQLTHPPDCEALCIDMDEPHYYRSWDKNWVGDQLWMHIESDENYMIRCVVRVLADCPWLDENPKAGMVEPGSSDNIILTINTTGFTEGDYSIKLIISSNDPGKPEVAVPVTLHVSPTNNPPQLSSGYVEPSSGHPSTDFYYYVNYYDSDGDSPTIKYFRIDGTAYPMSLYSGSASNGVYRYGPKNLTAGSHNYYFYFGDGKGGTARLPISGSYSGPSVSWGDFNPDFEANPREGEAPLEVEFDPTWTTGGALPYVKAEWDFNGDGIIDQIKSGANSMDIVTYTYASPGTYTISLTITDSSTPEPLVHTEVKIDYITVIGEAASVSIEPPTQRAAAGGTFSIDVLVDAGDYNLVGIDVELSYDSDAMSTSEAQITAHNLLGGMEIGPAVTDGKVRYVLVNTTPQADVSGSIMTIHFTVDEDAELGVYPLAVAVADLMSENGKPVVVDTDDGAVTIITGRKGDFDNDGDIDLVDFFLFAAAYDSEPGDDNYNSAGDFDDNGDIDIVDFFLFAAVYGT